MDKIHEQLVFRYGGVKFETLANTEKDVTFPITSSLDEQEGTLKDAFDVFEFLGKRKVIANWRHTISSGITVRPTTSNGNLIGHIPSGFFPQFKTTLVFTLNIPNIKLFQELFDSIEREWEQRNKKACKPVDTTPSFTLANQPTKTAKEIEGGQEEISKSTLCIDKKQGRFKYGEEEWGHKYGRGGVLKALARNPRYESSGGQTKEGTPVSMEALIDAFKEGEQRRIKGIGNQRREPPTITERSVRDAIDDIRKTARKHITKENTRRGIKKAAKELFEIKPLGGQFLLVLKG